MPHVHIHPDGYVVVVDDSGNSYMDTPANFAADLGLASAPSLPANIREVIYWAGKDLAVAITHPPDEQQIACPIGFRAVARQALAALTGTLMPALQARRQAAQSAALNVVATQVQEFTNNALAQQQRVAANSAAAASTATPSTATPSSPTS